MITISWTALFHAIFYRRRKKPWYKTRTSGTGRAVRYQKIDGEPRHWDLAQCLKEYYGDKNPPERKNLEFLLKLRNKIEHRHLPELDGSLYGECQASLLNLESLITEKFGSQFALQESLAVSLQFSSVSPPEQTRANRRLASSAARSVGEYIETYRAGLPAGVLNSMKYSYSVFLVPKVANRESASDAAIQFIKVDEASQAELERLEKLNVLIKEKHIPIANIDLFKPSQVLAELQSRVRYQTTMATHTAAWKRYKVRPATGATRPANTRSEYCVHDSAHGDYLYTKAWVEKLVQDLSDEQKYREITGRDPIEVDRND